MIFPYGICDFRIKYVKLKEAKITGKLTEKELQELPVMKENMAPGKKSGQAVWRRIGTEIF
ncbi:MAG: hypothetical protein GY795_28945 [Desulfobacterales bacterium]|nr:hypothetical protein [Desulfobacterales bacterium]